MIWHRIAFRATLSPGPKRHHPSAPVRWRVDSPQLATSRPDVSPRTENISSGLEIIWVVGIPKARRRPPHVNLGANMLVRPFDRVLNDADAVAELRDMVRAVIGGQIVLQGLGHSDACSRYEDHEATILHVGAPAETGGPNAQERGKPEGKNTPLTCVGLTGFEPATT